MDYPDAVDASKVGTYPATVAAGGGYVWDAVLEYRVWWHPEDGSGDCFRAFATYAEALAFSQEVTGAEDPLALILQLEHLNEPEPGQFVHVLQPRVTEWPVGSSPNSCVEVVRGHSGV